MADTIVAVSTCVRPALHAILRLSGPESERLAALVFAGPSDRRLAGLRAYAKTTGRLLHERAFRAIPATAYVFRAPKSYTREDVVEIHFPGSPPLAESLLEMLLSKGARLAEPGEFTRRAFENGRIDLAKAEAVLAMVTSHSRAQVRAATRQLGGTLSTALSEVSQQLVNLLSIVELAVDFSDQDVPATSDAEVATRLRAIGTRIKGIVDNSSNQGILRGAIRVALVGRANVGKSSLLNALLAERRAIVNADAGTTRDAIEARTEIEGIPFVLVDLAGKNTPTTDVERHAWKIALREGQTAEIALLVYDAAAGFTHADADLLVDVGDSPVVVAANKIDLVQGALDRPVNVPPERFVPASALTGVGIDTLRAALARLVRRGEHAQETPAFLLAAGQRQQLRAAGEACGRAADGLEAGAITLDLAAIELREALDRLGEVAGVAAGEAVLDRIFSQFCIGK